MLDIATLGRAARQAQYPINPQFTGRWSPRAMTGESMSDEELLALFEAARWAPSSFNNQPWRFIVARRDTPEWETLFGLLGDFNQQWCVQAAALVVVVSRNVFDFNGKPAVTHSFDTGAAWMSLALQAVEHNIVAHGMEGFDYAKAKERLGVPDEYTVEAMVALGRPGAKETLPAELQEKETPSQRKPLANIVFKGRFGERYV